MAFTRTDIKTRENAPYGTFTIKKRVPSSLTTYARAVFFHFTNQNFNIPSVFKNEEDSDFLDVKTILAEEEIASVNISKSISNPSASFNIELFPTQNWKSQVSPGDWVAIYLFNKVTTEFQEDKLSNKNLVMLGNIDRVSRNLDRDEDDDKMTLRFNVSGRNFGKVLEDTAIWYDPYINQQNVVDVMLRSSGLEIIGNPTTQSNKVLDVFLGGGAQFSKGRTKGLKQWQIPSKLVSLVNTKPGDVEREVIEGTFDQILRREIETNLPGYKTRTMLSLGTSESLWGYLHRTGNPLINEIFLELIRDDDKRAYPSIIIRPRPFNTIWMEDNFGKEKSLISRLNSQYKTLQQLAKESFVEITQGEIYFEDLGRDDHSRFNMFWLDTPRRFEQYRSIYADVNVAKTIGNPFFSRESIRRHGLRKFQQYMEYHMAVGERKEVTSDVQIFKAFMAQLFDMNFYNHMYESGTIETAGVLEAELGKVLIVLPDEGKADKKIYYTEGYEHKWNFPNTWRTIFTVTQGQFLSKNKSDDKIFIDSESEDKGKKDSAFNNMYIAKTRTRNKR